MRALIGLAAIGGALWLSWRFSSQLGDLVPSDERGEALDLLEKAALEMYPTVNLNPKRTPLFSSDEYTTKCGPMTQALTEAANAVIQARSQGLYGGDALGVAVAQYAALAALECPDTPLPEWVDQASP